MSVLLACFGVTPRRAANGPRCSLRHVSASAATAPSAFGSVLHKEGPGPITPLAILDIQPSTNSASSNSSDLAQAEGHVGAAVEDVQKKPFAHSHSEPMTLASDSDSVPAPQSLLRTATAPPARRPTPAAAAAAACSTMKLCRMANSAAAQSSHGQLPTAAPPSRPLDPTRRFSLDARPVHMQHQHAYIPLPLLRISEQHMAAAGAGGQHPRASPRTIVTPSGVAVQMGPSMSGLESMSRALQLVTKGRTLAEAMAEHRAIVASGMSYAEVAAARLSNSSARSTATFGRATPSQL